MEKRDTHSDKSVPVRIDWSSIYMFSLFTMDGHRTLLFHPNPRCGGTSSLSIKCFKKNEKRDISLLWWMMILDRGWKGPRKNYKSRRCHFLTKVVLQRRSSGIARRRIITARFRKISSTQHYCFLSPWKSHFIHQCSAKHHYSFVFERRRRRKKSLNKTVALYYIYNNASLVIHRIHFER